MKIYITILFNILALLSIAQSKALKDNRKIEKQTIFGIQVSPILPTNFLEKNDYTFQSDTVNYSINSQASFSYGVEIRHYFTYRFAVNTGIMYTKRNIKVDYSSEHTTNNNRLTDTTFTRDLKFIAFEIPVRASGYVRLSKEIYMSIAGGVNINFYPSDIRVDNVYVQRMGTFGWMFFQLGVSASLGWEYRTKDSGIFFIGGSYQTRFDNMASILLFEKETIHKADYYHNITGSYFSIDFKYFFPINESKKR